MHTIRRIEKGYELYTTSNRIVFDSSEQRGIKNRVGTLHNGSWCQKRPSDLMKSHNRNRVCVL